MPALQGAVARLETGVDNVLTLRSTADGLDLCQLCGGRPVTHELGHGGQWAAECEDCGHQGPHAETAWQCAVLWNKEQRLFESVPLCGQCMHLEPGHERVRHCVVVDRFRGVTDQAVTCARFKQANKETGR